jgi:hypothetical protein
VSIDSDENVMEYDDLKEIMKVVSKNTKSESDLSSGAVDGGWSLLPENVLVKIFKYLSSKEITSCSECCKRWNFISNDSLLWKYKFQHDFKVDKNIPRKPGNHI